MSDSSPVSLETLLRIGATMAKSALSLVFKCRCGFLLMLACGSMLYPRSALAQNIQYNNKAADLGLRSDLRVNPASRALEITIPLGNYPGRAGLGMPVTLTYSSKVHRMNFEGYVQQPPPPHGSGESWTIVVAKYGEHSAAGWTTSLSAPVLDTFSTQIYNGSGNPVSTSASCTPVCYEVDRVVVWMPDGSSHELRSTDQPFNIFPSPQLPDNLYSIDGSRLRYQRSTATLFLPDGSRYLFSGQFGLQFIDRNGNKLTYGNGGWTDTLGRLINDPLKGMTQNSSGGTPTSATDDTVSFPGVAGTSLSYTFRWRYLSDPGVLTTSQALPYVANSGCPLTVRICYFQRRHLLWERRRSL